MERRGVGDSDNSCDDDGGGDERTEPTDTKGGDSAIVSALSIRPGITSVVGAGGKKTTLYDLVGRLERTVLTATVRIPIFDRHVSTVRVTSDPTRTLRRESVPWPLGLVADRDRTDRYTGYDPSMIDEIAAHEIVSHVLVKADGARTRLLKAPNDREPQLPKSTRTVIALASAHAVGEPLNETVVHRPDRVGAITGRSFDDPIEPIDVATVLSSPKGGLKRVPPDATYVPVVNMVDTDDDFAVAREIATHVLESDVANAGRIDRVVLTSHRREDPLVSVIEQ